MESCELPGDCVEAIQRPGVQSMMPDDVALKEGLVNEAGCAAETKVAGCNRAGVQTAQ